MSNRTSLLGCMTILLSFPIWGLVPFANFDVQAEALSIAQRVAVPVSIESEADEVLCIGKSSGQVQVSRGILNTLIGNGGAGIDSSRQKSRALVGCPFASALDGEGMITVVVRKRGEPPKVFGASAESILEYEALLDSEEKARAHLLKQREVLASYQVQVKSQELALVRLREDADLIGAETGFAKLEAQVKNQSRELESIEREIRNLEVSGEQIKGQPAPANGASREIEITKQLSELAQVARVAEEHQRAEESSGHSELAESMRLIEETRFDQPEQIRAELIKVRRRRQELEETLQDHSQSVVDYE